MESYHLFRKTVIQNLADQNYIEVFEIMTNGEIKIFDEDKLTKGIYIMKSRKEFEKHYFRDEL